MFYDQRADFYTAMQTPPPDWLKKYQQVEISVSVTL
jgi:hypothetical protein